MSLMNEDVIEQNLIRFNTVFESEEVKDDKIEPVKLLRLPI